MLKVNLLENPHFINGTDYWTLGAFNFSNVDGGNSQGIYSGTYIIDGGISSSSYVDLQVIDGEKSSG